jgi:hypothetical protein
VATLAGFASSAAPDPVATLAGFEVAPDTKIDAEVLFN